MISRAAAYLRTWRVPSAAELQAMSEHDAAAAYVDLRRERARALVLAEMQRRDEADEAVRRRAETAAARRARARAAREPYDLYVHAEFLRAEAECRGSLLSRAGIAAGVDPIALWPMGEARAMRLASEELRAYWGQRGRLTYAQWREQSREPEPEEVSA